LAVLDNRLHDHPPSAYHIYKIFIGCTIVGGEARSGVETEQIGFFSIDELPELSLGRTTHEEIELMYEHYYDESKPADID
jgi:ADP-ribose pyrophosphatase YjhB (NUDIX family)